MPHRSRIFAGVLALATLLFAPALNALEISPFWGYLCAASPGHAVSFSTASAASPPPVAQCGAAPSGFSELPSVGIGQDTSVSLQIGYDPDTQRLCYVSTALPEAPVLRVGVGHTLSITVTNTLQDTGTPAEINCPIDAFEGEGDYCFPKQQFAGQPGADGPYYKLMANQAHTADGTSNLHVHGLFVSPRTCSDEVLRSTIYPTNWGGPVARMPACQSAPNTLTYSYRLPADHPAGLYWYHTHRHGQSEQQTQMGLAGAIVVEDAGDTWRQSIGVSDEVLVVTDTPKTGCLIGVSCDIVVRRPPVKSTAKATRASAAARSAASASPPGTPALDPRIDQVNQAGCAQGADDATGGTELWTLKLNGAAVPEGGASFPPDSELLGKTMQPGQRQIFRLVNAAADSFISPRLVLSQNGVQTVEPLEVFARDGVGLADAQGRRHFTAFDVAQTPFVVPPASRVEFVVHAPPAGATLYLDSAQFAPGCGGNAYPARRLLKITSAGASVDPGAADDSDLLQHTPSLAGYLATLVVPPTVHRTLVLAEYGRSFTYGVTRWRSGPPTTSDYDGSQTDFYIPEVASDDGEVEPHTVALRPFNGHGGGPPQVVVHLHGQDSVTEQWLIENSTLEAHAFHMHQVHFRDVTVDSTDPDQQPILDTINVPPAVLVGDVASGTPGAPGWVRLNMTFSKADIGEFVFHCHILEHEDSGMMGKIQVVAE